MQPGRSFRGHQVHCRVAGLEANSKVGLGPGVDSLTRLFLRNGVTGLGEPRRKPRANFIFSAETVLSSPSFSVTASAYHTVSSSDDCARTPSVMSDYTATCAASAPPTCLESLSANRSFKGFLNLPVEIRLQIYTYLIIPKDPTSGLNPWGCYFSVEPPFRFHTEILRVSRQVNQEAKKVLYSDLKYPWRINVNSTTNKGMSGKVLNALDLLPCMMTSTNVQLNFYFFAPVKGTEPSHTAQETWSGIDYICRALSAVPIARNIGIFWWDAQENAEWETKRICLNPLAMFSANCSFRLTGGGLQDNFYKNFKRDRRECFDYLEKVTGRVVEWVQPAPPGPFRVGFPTLETRVCRLRR